MDKDKKAGAEGTTLGMIANTEKQMVRIGIYRVERTYDCWAATRLGRRHSGGLLDCNIATSRCILSNQVRNEVYKSNSLIMTRCTN